MISSEYMQFIPKLSLTALTTLRKAQLAETKKLRGEIDSLIDRRRLVEAEIERRCKDDSA